MQIRFVTNACFEIIAKSARILCDPWLTPGAFDGAWFHSPPLRLGPDDFKEYTHLYISHIHPDHCDMQTLPRLAKKDVPVIVLKTPDGFVRKRLQSCGFSSFIELADGETVDIGGGVKVTMYAAFDDNPFVDSAVPNIIDSSIVVNDGVHCFLNINDNTPTVEAANRLISEHGHFRAALVPYSGVGPWPSSYLGLSTGERVQAAKKKAEQYLVRMLETSAILKADVFLPGAGQMILGGAQFWKNDFLGVATQQEAVDTLRAAGYQTEALREGDVFDVGSSVVEHTLRVGEWTLDALSRLKQERYFWEGSSVLVERSDLLPRLQLARDRLWKYQQRFGFTANWLLAIRLEDEPEEYYTFDFGVETPVQKMSAHDVHKGERSFLLAVMPYEYLVALLARRCHWNNGFHGCHIDWLRVPDDYKPELQTLLSFFHV